VPTILPFGWARSDANVGGTDPVGTGPDGTAFGCGEAGGGQDVMIVSRGQSRADGRSFGCSLGSLPVLPKERHDHRRALAAVAFLVPEVAPWDDNRKPFTALTRAGRVTIE
jgi:hypothetical protein